MRRPSLRRSGPPAKKHFGGQRRDRPHSRLRHQQPRVFIFLGRFFRRHVQRLDLPVQHVHQLQQIFSPAAGPRLQWKFAQQLLARFTPQLPLPLHALIQRQMLQLIFHLRPHPHQFVAVNQQLPGQHPSPLHWKESRSAEIFLPPAASTKARHPADHASVFARRWRESSPRLQSTLRVLDSLIKSTISLTVARGLQSRSATEPETAGNTFPPRPARALTSFLLSPRSTGSTNKPVANWGENRFHSEPSKAPFVPGASVLQTEAYSAAIRAFVLIQSILCGTQRVGPLNFLFSLALELTSPTRDVINVGSAIRR